MQDRLNEVSEQVFLRARRRWQWAQVTPLLYLLLAQLARYQGWVHEPGETPALWGDSAENTILAFTGLALLAIALWLRFRQSRVADRFGADPAQAIKRWSYEFYMLISLADTAAFAALFIFFFTAHFGVMLAGGALAYALYALVHPRRRDLLGLYPPRDMLD